MIGVRIECRGRRGNAAGWRWAAASASLSLALGASAEPADRTAVFFAPHDRLPEGGPETLAEVYYAAGEIPGVAVMSAAHRRGLLDVVTERYKNRLIDRAGLPEEVLLGHVERLSRSGLAARRPLAVAQTCAQHGLVVGACAAHEGYVRRALLLEEMLAAGRLSLGDLEEELIGSSRPSLSARRSERL